MPLDSVGFLTGVVADLVAGRDYIKRNGWCQHQSRDGMRVCALGGLLEVTPDNARQDAACVALARALRASLGQPREVAGWNDEPGRTIDDVLALYDLAIERELSAA